jgi:ribosome-associated protein
VTQQAGEPTDATTALPRPDGLPRRGRRATVRAGVNAGGPGAAGDAPADDRPAIDLARRIVELAEDKKAADIVLLDLTGQTTVADYFVIASGGSERQLDAIADGIVSGMRDEKVHVFGREGTAASHWVLLDFGSVIVHVFTPPERDYYQLERHWSEARTILRLQ